MPISSGIGQIPLYKNQSLARLYSYTELAGTYIIGEEIYIFEPNLILGGLTAKQYIAFNFSHLLKQFAPKSSIVEGSTIDLIEEQLKKHLSPIVVTPNGISTDTSDEHLLKHAFPIVATPDGIVIDVSDEQPSKHDSPKLVTPEGIFIDAREEQPLKHWLLRFSNTEEDKSISVSE